MWKWKFSDNTRNNTYDEGKSDENSVDRQDEDEDKNKNELDETEEEEEDEDEEGEGEEGENEEDDDEEDDEDEEDELKNYGIALEMPKRKNRGRNLKKLIGEDLEKDEKFWNDSIWEEEEVDEEYVNSEGEEEYVDVTDSDFDDDEDGGEEDDDDEDEEQNENEGDDDDSKRKKKKIYAYMENLKKKKMLKYNLMKKRKYDNMKNIKSKSDIREKTDDQKNQENKKQRKRKRIEQNYIMLHRSTRDTTRQKTEQMEKKFELRRIKKEDRFKKFYENRQKKKGMQREMTREERLEEAKITEQYNMQSLLELQAWEEEKKKYVESKRIIYHKPKNVFISFSYSKDNNLPLIESLKYEMDAANLNNHGKNITADGELIDNNGLLIAHSTNIINSETDKNIIGIGQNSNEIHCPHPEQINKKEEMENEEKINGKEQTKGGNDIITPENAENLNNTDKKNKEVFDANIELNLENLDRCEDLNIEYLNEKDGLAFDCLNSINNNNAKDDNDANNLNKTREQKKEPEPRDIEEKQFYIVTDPNELSMYSNYNSNNKEWLEKFKNKRNICSITNLEGKYFDPLTKKYYNNADAFKLLRFFYHKNMYDDINNQLSMMVDIFKNKLIEIEESTKKQNPDNI
ncbi:YL1 nuclear protein, putative [Plasmodium chabaudi adami]|uniref:YL1 nuclear protein, putative n=1 Tax=Plasmodium chabaudi adami TaxID=5826 RepID=A0A1C6XVN1_PLACE|nr:YL1 nuclear protein, putative [Plasmodium chabaudi adami]